MPTNFRLALSWQGVFLVLAVKIALKWGNEKVLFLHYTVAVNGCYWHLQIL